MLDMEKQLTFFLMFIAIPGTFNINCFNCTSEMWLTNENCELPNEDDTPTNDICTKDALCYTIYTTGPSFLVRGCWSQKSFEYIFKAEDRIAFEACETDLCNSLPINWQNTETREKDNDYLLEKNAKECYRCSSTPEKPERTCEFIDENTTIANHCQNRFCIILYDRETKHFKRDCMYPSTIVEYKKNPPGNWTVRWCTESKCNTKSMTEFPYCKEGIYSEYYRGCLVLKRALETDGRGEVEIMATEKESSEENKYNGLNLVNSSILCHILFHHFFFLFVSLLVLSSRPIALSKN